MNKLIIDVLQILKIVLPSLIQVYKHYIEITKNNKFTLEDKEKAKKILKNLKWKSWEDIEKEIGGK